MSRIRALIVDDEPLAREGIQLRLERHPDIEIIGAVGRAADAVTAIKRLSPDVLFLDVQMPGMSGFDVLSKVGVGKVPVVIFVTAHDEHALRAFRSHALDYLLKPIDDERFVDALARARRQLSTLRDGEAGRRLRGLLAEVGLAEPTNAAEYIDRMAVGDRGRISFVDVADIEWIEAHGDYVRLHAAGRAHLVREKLRELERRLDPKRFLRVHRSTIVNLKNIGELQPYFHGEYIIVTTSGARLRVSRTHRAALASALGTSI